ncbi:MAG TPA: hypothetical protein VK694_03890 [Verrucomicrobiae bacterium]|nr:hypothetical protein [Verrucomicrobiae bacterium]
MKQKQTVLYCFSPPVMVATFLIESALLAYVLWRYKMSPIVRLISSALVFLATFQLAEYYVCGGTGTSAALWSRVGFVAITALPPLGLHLVHLIAERPGRRLVYIAYATGLAWAVLFGAGDWAFVGHACGGNYVIFDLRGSLMELYCVYYYGWLLGGIVLATRFLRKAKKKQGNALMLLVAGYLVFLLPTATVNILRPESLMGIPSIMCGFAVVFAFILTFGVLPQVTPKPKEGK